MNKVKAINEKIKSMERKYKNDEEAMGEINQAKDTIAYYIDKGEEDKAFSHARQLEAFLHDWY